MKIISTSDSFIFQKDPKKMDRQLVFCDPGCIFTWEDDELKISHYSSKLGKGKYFSYKNKIYQQTIEINTKEEKYINISEENDIFSMDDQFKPFFRYGPPVEDFDQYFVKKDYSNRKDKALYLCNMSRKQKVKIPSESITGKIFNNNVFTVDRAHRRVVKVGFDGEIIWEFGFDFEVAFTTLVIINNPIPEAENTFLFYGSRSYEEQPDKGGKKFRPLGGVLLALDSASGRRKWSVELEHGLFQMESKFDYLYLLSGSRLIVVNKENGAFEKNIELGFDLYFQNGPLSRPYLFIDETYIFASSPRDQKFLIIDRKNKDIIRDVKLPDGCRVIGHNYTDLISGKHYFRVSTWRWDIYNSPILEVDPKVGFPEVAFEEEPDHTVLLVESENVGKEVRIDIKNASIDDLIRFGEIYVRDEAHRYSYNHTGRTFVGREFCPEDEFNGIIRLRAINCTDIENKLKECLSIMVERFDKWNDDEACYSCIDKSQLTKLVTEIMG